MKFGDDTVSDYQEQLLEKAKGRISPGNLLHIFEQVFGDPDITFDRESVHPDWLPVFQKNRSSLKSVASPKQFREIEQFVQKMSPVDPRVADLNPEEGSLCFLIGAGASKPHPSDIPTVGELLPYMLDRARRLDREDVTKLADFCEERGIENIEDLLTAAQLAAFCSRNPNILRLVDFLLYADRTQEPGEARRRRRHVDLSSVAFLQDTLQVLFALLSSIMLPAKPNHAHGAIVKYAQSHSDSHIITTNYDCCMDLALREKNVDFSYGLDFINLDLPNGAIKSGIGLTKLHGSLNWFYCETCQDVLLIDIKETVDDFLKDKKPYPVIAVCRVCGGQCRPLLVPPLAIKFDLAPPLVRLLDRANEAFKAAKTIVVVGFSFAEADLYISRMLSKSMQVSKEQKLLIFDPEWSVVGRIQRKLEASIPDFDPNRVLRVRGDCAELLPKFLKGEMVRTVEVGASESVAKTTGVSS